MDPSAERRAVESLFRYVESLIGFREQVLLDLDRAGPLVAHQKDLEDQEGVALNDGEAWVKLRRLRPEPPPAPPELLASWVELRPDPARPPTLRDDHVVNMPPEDADDLIEAGIAGVDSARTPLGRHAPGTVDVHLESARIPGFHEAFEAWRDGEWSAWAARERPRRRAIDLYGHLFEYHQLVQSAAADSSMELVIGVGVVRWRVGGERLNVPLIEQPVETAMQGDGTLLVRPRELPPRIALRAFEKVQEGRGVRRELTEALEAAAEESEEGFSPFMPASFEGVLRQAAARLDASGVYWPDSPDREGDTLPPIDSRLKVTGSWVLFARRRSLDVRRADIERLIELLAEEDELPHPLQGIVTRPEERPEAPAERDDTLPPGGEASGEAQDAVTRRRLFFPLPYNREQRQVAERLDTSTAVVVQGPPGTGKSHTIANIVAHYMARGLRVLVTAKTPEALVAVREKFPAELQDLVIAAIHSDREGARQLARAIDLLATQAKGLDEAEATAEAVDKLVQVDRLEAEITALDGDLLGIAERNLKGVVFSGREMLPAELARLVVEDRERFAWFPDRPDLAAGAPPLDEEHIARIRELRLSLGLDLGLDEAVWTARLPDVREALALHDELIRAPSASIDLDELPVVTQGSLEVASPEEIRELLLELRRFLLARAREPLPLALFRAGGEPDAALAELRSDFEDLGSRFQVLQDHRIELGEGDGEDLERPLQRLAAGRRAFWLFGLGRGEAKRLLATIRIGRRTPASAEEWRLVIAWRQLQTDALRFRHERDPVLRQHGLSLPAEDAPRLLATVARLRFEAAEADALGRELRGLLPELERLFPYGLAVETLAVGRRETVELALRALDAALGHEDTTARGQVQRLFELAEAAGGTRLGAALEEALPMLGNDAFSERAVAETWAKVQEAAADLRARAPLLDELREVVDPIAEAGAPEWAGLLATIPVEGGIDRLTPSDWREAWAWAQADGFVSSLDERERIRELGAGRDEADAFRRRLFADVIRLKTFIGLKRNLTPSVEAALAKYMVAVRRLGAGTGASAGRFRRMIREATREAAHAIPCWVLPEDRVAEQLPSALGAFDLVIVDEASQSEISALPILARGKKLLIVGDDKQVSPTVIGIDDAAVAQLRATWLMDSPWRDYLDPATSLYDIAGIVFPGRVIMLREHFRCVEPIIRYSDRFYPQPLIPLRVPGPSERLDPPLIDVRVTDGARTGDVNRAEAAWMAEEIASLVTDPDIGERSIGVICLHGTAQARLIHGLLLDGIGPEAMERHRILCGNAATFQGQERSIVFLSMVHCPATARLQRAPVMEQRYNVAVSRARDRVYLVRSVGLSDLKAGDLKRGLIEHMASPMAGVMSTAAQEDVIARCESPFEIEVARRLLAQGYRVRAQYPVGARRIDFVIEGDDDRRLAVELDGASAHGPERWLDDIARQQALERLGWRFWRCWGTHWWADPDGCLADLVETLERHGIRPLHGQPPRETWTRHIEVTAETAPAPTEVEDDLRIEPGDRVTLRWLDDPSRTRRIVVDGGDGSAAVLLGAGEQDEIELPDAGTPRAAVIEAIEKRVHA